MRGERRRLIRRTPLPDIFNTITGADWTRTFKESRGRPNDLMAEIREKIARQTANDPTGRNRPTPPQQNENAAPATQQSEPDRETPRADDPTAPNCQD
jgi:hypothetical protein